MRISSILMAMAAASLASGCATTDTITMKRDSSRGTVPTFSSEHAVDAYVKALGIERAKPRGLPEYDDNVIVVTGAQAANPQITNTQEEGVDEGGIVKATAEYLIVLRRGKIFTIRHGDNQLSPTASIDAFPPNDDDPDDTWYDEMLVSGNTIVTIGYSYGDNGTEISRFTLGVDGGLSYRDTHYITSDDYYSSRNYASRLIGDELILYSPIDMNWADWRESMPSVSKRSADGKIERVRQEGLDNLHLPQRFVDKPHPQLDILHTVTRCDLTSEELDCTAQMVLGTWSRNFYITRDAVYIWTSSVNSWQYEQGEGAPAMLYKVGLDYKDVQAIGVAGSPIDQFSFFEDNDEDRLHVVVESDGYGDAMFDSEFSFGDSALLQLPLDSFGDGSAEAPKWAYRGLPSIDGYRKQNRYVGRHLLYGGGYYDDEEDSPALYVSPLDQAWVQRIDLPHGVSRLDSMGQDGFVAGQSLDEALGFSAILLDEDGGTATLGSTFLMPSAEEGENRSQAFFFRPDPGAEEGESGTLALPVSRDLEDDQYEFLGRASALAFLRREDRALKDAGTLDADYKRTFPDECVASCTDWYGNARPIFLGDRIFALLGYEMVEGVLQDGWIAEKRRISFSPKSVTEEPDDAEVVDQ